MKEEGTKIKSLSFAKEYEREYRYIMQMKNASKYICDLIKRDLECKKGKKRSRRYFKIKK